MSQTDDPRTAHHCSLYGEALITPVTEFGPLTFPCGISCAYVPVQARRSGLRTDSTFKDEIALSLKT